MFLIKAKALLYYIISILFVLLTTIFALLYRYGQDLPSAATLTQYLPPQTTRIFDKDGKLLEEYASEHRVIVNAKKIPALIKGAFIVAEDREFYTHSGINIRCLIRAILDNTARNNWETRPTGGSTITQQLAKNLLVGNSRTISRKIREAIMAVRIESTIPKDTILEIYLNQLYLGKGCYGILEACNYYFGKSLENIEPNEAAFLASIPSAPMVYINKKNSLRLLRKRQKILNQMYEMGYIDYNTFIHNFNKKLKLKNKKEKLYAPYFAEEIFRIATKFISRDDFFRNGYQITTTLDRHIQTLAQKALEDGIIEYTKQTKWHGTIGNIKENKEINLAQINSKLPVTLNKIKSCLVKFVKKKHLICQDADGKLINVEIPDGRYKEHKHKPGDVILCRKLDTDIYEIYQYPKVTGGIIVMDANNGDILALVGGYSPDICAFNCMTQAKRQPGSTIKPFVYVSALENGKDECAIVDDKLVTITLKSGAKYTPHNYDGKEHGKTSLRDGLIYSRNLTTVNLALDIGMDNISNTLKSFGLIKRNVPISAVLGSIEICPLQLLKAFSAFFNEGKMINPRFIKQANLKWLVSREPPRQVISEQTAETMKNILHDAVIIGTGHRIATLEQQLNVKFYGKTGTTNNFKDAWFLGAIETTSKTLLVCTFVGYAFPKSLGEHMSGAKVALPIFANFAKSLIRNGCS